MLKSICLKIYTPRNLLIIGSWCGLLLFTVIFSTKFFHYGWDEQVYTHAVHSVRMQHDPYKDGTDAQIAYHAPSAAKEHTPFPFAYVYSPATLPLLHLLTHFSARPIHRIFWLLYLLGAMVPPIVTLQFTHRKERFAFSLLAPFSLFLNGLLIRQAICSGNIAYILYGLIFLGAYFGWKRDRWLPFYLAVLFAASFKAPMLSLIALPVFSARRQWVPAGITGVIGTAIFLLPRLLMPATFANYMRAIEFQFTYNHDFGLSPDAVFARFLVSHGHDYTTGSALFYIVYALLLLAVLFHLRGKFLAGRLAASEYIPLLAPAVILLNPRIMEYDAAPVSLFLVIVAWRSFLAFTGSVRAALTAYAVIFALMTVLCQQLNDNGWRTAAACTIVAALTAGIFRVHTLLHTADGPAHDLTILTEAIPEVKFDAVV